MIKKFDSFGAVECLLDSDPKQYKMQDGRWTFDPGNLNYEKAFWLLFPQLAPHCGKVSLGNVLESILGVYEAAVHHGHVLQERMYVRRVTGLLNCFVHAVYNVTLRTGTEHWAVSEWLDWVNSIYPPPPPPPSQW
jgi:hypothetical protein